MFPRMILIRRESLRPIVLRIKASSRRKDRLRDNWKQNPGNRDWLPLDDVKTILAPVACFAQNYPWLKYIHQSDALPVFLIEIHEPVTRIDCETCSRCLRCVRVRIDTADSTLASNLKLRRSSNESRLIGCINNCQLFDNWQFWYSFVYILRNRVNVERNL